VQFPLGFYVFLQLYLFGDITVPLRSANLFGLHIVFRTQEVKLTQQTVLGFKQIAW